MHRASVRANNLIPKNYMSSNTCDLTCTLDLLWELVITSSHHTQEIQESIQKWILHQEGVFIKNETPCKQDICIKPIFLFGKRVQLSNQRGMLEERGWVGRGGWGLRPTHGSQQQWNTERLQHVLSLPARAALRGIAVQKGCIHAKKVYPKASKASPSGWT